MSAIALGLPARPRASRRWARRLAAALLLAPFLLLAGLHGWAQWEVHRMASASAQAPRPEAQQISTTTLLDIPGHRMTVAMVKFPPGARSPEHHHEATVFVYVLAGAIRSAVSGQAPGVFSVGQTFEEPLGSVHLYADNASEAEPAAALVVFIHTPEARLTVYH
jgi:quercetin dioxygenase-like cupin family protein